MAFVQAAAGVSADNLTATAVLAAAPTGRLTAFVSWTNGDPPAFSMPAGWVVLYAPLPGASTCRLALWTKPATAADQSTTVTATPAVGGHLVLTVVETTPAIVNVPPVVLIDDPDVATHLLPDLTPLGTSIDILALTCTLNGFSVTGLPAGYTKQLETFSPGGSSSQSLVLSRLVPIAAGASGGTLSWAPNTVRYIGAQVAYAPAPAGLAGDLGGAVW